ncbi:MAG: hypothetical protein HUJ90_00825 [Bacteroidales bacterium]|nr:hypothetical protein [Bacteroidales bacterium]
MLLLSYCSATSAITGVGAALSALRTGCSPYGGGVGLPVRLCALSAVGMEN